MVEFGRNQAFAQNLYFMGEISKFDQNLYALEPREPYIGLHVFIGQSRSGSDLKTTKNDQF